MWVLRTELRASARAVSGFNAQDLATTLYLLSPDELLAVVVFTWVDDVLFPFMLCALRMYKLC